MKLYFDCVPCIVQQCVDTIRKFVKDEKDQYRLLGEFFDDMQGQVRKNTSSPVLFSHCYNRVKEVTGIEDLYLAEKDLFNMEMLAMEEEFRRIIKTSADPLGMALCLCAAANIIDFGVVKQLNKDFVLDVILKTVGRKHEYLHIEQLKTELIDAKQLLYVGDNCGEVVLDKLVLELLKEYYPQLHIIFVVRGKPILNDVTMKEARELGLDRYATLMSSGSDLPGMVLSHCSAEFQQYYAASDVVILKGMGNIETAEQQETKAFFIFMAKCKFMANHLGVEQYEILIVKGNALCEENR